MNWCAVTVQLQMALYLLAVTGLMHSELSITFALSYVNSFVGGNALLLRSCYKESNHYNVFGSITYCSEESHRNNYLEMMLIS